MSSSRPLNLRYGLRVGSKDVIDSSGILSDVGDISTLTTTSKTSIVEAINEVGGYFTGITTANVAESEGGPLYFTESRVHGSFLYGTGISFDSETKTLSLSSSADVTFNSISGPSEFVIDPATVGDDTGTVVIRGNLTVNGTTTTINSTIVSVSDIALELGATETPTDVTANGGGLILKGTADKTLLWYDATDTWTSSENISLATGKSYRINDTVVLSGDTLGTGILYSSLTSVGTIGTGTWQANTISSTYGGTGQTEYTDGQILIGRSSDGGLVKTTLTQGANISVTNGSGSITVALSENVDISGTLDVTGVATFDNKISIGAAEPAAEAEIGWNTGKGTLDIGLLNGVISPYGQDIITLCRNNTASTIAKGAAVMFTGTIEDNGILTIAPMVSNGTYPGYVFFGVTAQSIAAGADGYVRSFGEIKGVNTDIDEGGVGGQWVEGDILWCNPAAPGGFTKFEPLAPNLKLPVAAVVSVGNDGILFVRWDTGRRLQDLHDVDANGATTDGDLLQYSAINSRWEHVTDVTLPGRVVINGTDITESARDIEESRLIRKNATVSIGVAGTVPFGVGPIIPPGMSLVGIGPDSYNVIDIYSGSVC